MIASIVSLVDLVRLSVVNVLTSDSVGPTFVSCVDGCKSKDIENIGSAVETSQFRISHYF